MTNTSHLQADRTNRKKRSPLLWLLPSTLAIFIVAMPVRSQVLDAVEDIAGDVAGDVLGGFGDIGEFIFSLIDDLLVDINLAQWRTTVEEILNGNGSCLGNLPILTFVPLEDGDYCAGGSGDSGTSSDAVADIVVDAQGEMGIPNPNKIRREIEQKVASTATKDIPDLFERNPVVYGTVAANQAERDLTTVHIDTILGEEGQKQTKKQIDSTQATVKSIASIAKDAQADDVTQDVMKKQVEITAQQSVISGVLLTNSLQARHDTQFTNLNLKNSSRTLDELARNERVASSSNALAYMAISSQSVLQ